MKGVLPMNDDEIELIDYIEEDDESVFVMPRAKRTLHIKKDSGYKRLVRKRVSNN